MIGKRLRSYLVTARLGRGGMGTVYLAVDPATGADVALKVLAESLSADPHVLQRFELEQQIVSSLDHPGIVQGRSGVLCEDGVHFFVMDFVPGANLQRILRALSRLAPEEAVDLGVQMCDALAFAHARGVVHRDLKPSNLLIDPDARVHVTDFGLAKITEFTRVTLTGQILGTPEYMSPEQAEGRPSDARSDLYAAGVVLYEMLTGAVPFHAENPLAVLRKHVGELPEPPSRRQPGLPARLDAVVLRCLEKDPLRRHESAAALAADLRDALGKPPGPDARARLIEIVRTSSLQETRPYLAPTAPASGRTTLPPPHRRAPAALLWSGLGAALIGGALLVRALFPASAAEPPLAAVALTDGSSLQGRIVSVTGGVLTLARPDGSRVNVPLERIERVKYAGESGR